jgi:ankyrin repeat protein
MSFLGVTASNSLLLKLPNELLFEVVSNLESFQDLNSLVRTTRLFHTLFNTNLYRRAVAAKDSVRGDIVQMVLSEYRPSSLTLLLDNGLSVHQKLGWDSKKLLQWVCAYCSDEKLSIPLAQLLVERGVDIAEKHPADSSTALHLAALNGNCGIAAFLLENGADVNAVTTGRWRPLHFAVKTRNQDPSIIDLLIAHGAAVDARNREGKTPLLLAALYGNTHLAPALLAHGADARAYDNKRVTLMHLFTYLKNRNKDRKLAKSLLEYDPDVNATDLQGRTPLHWISDSTAQHPWKVDFLLNNGAHINALCRKGYSPLKLALECSFSFGKKKKSVDRDRVVAVVRLLITRGADVSVLDSEDRAKAVEMGIQIDN